jgi:predicted transcriptional regulator
LAEAHEALSNATKASNDHAEATRKRAEAFSAEQADIDQRLKTITQSETSDEAVRRLEKSMERLQRLELSKGYVELLKEAEELRYAFTNVGDRAMDAYGLDTARKP